MSSRKQSRWHARPFGFASWIYNGWRALAPPSLPVPAAAVDPAIPRAYTDKLEEGLPPQAKNGMTFTAAAMGDYFIFCGVPGHGRSGMYIGFEVSADAKAPRLQQVPKPPAGG